MAAIGARGAGKDVVGGAGAVLIALDADVRAIAAAVIGPITNLTKESLKDSGLDNKSIIRSKNMFALGMVYYIFDRPLSFTEKFFEKKFSKKPEVVEANKKVLRNGFNYAANK
ncbi:MAG: 2-oxoacid:acceptor oxidoreductase family protein, partial [Methyloversatilis sp.]|nr:2-oxoacid:acceptor oxidoreductase family protein [Methyloversatilis sp.]